MGGGGCGTGGGCGMGNGVGGGPGIGHGGIGGCGCVGTIIILGKEGVILKRIFNADFLIIFRRARSQRIKARAMVDP